MNFRSISEIAKSQAEDGKFWQQHFYKTSQPTALAGTWSDGSVGSGIPGYNAYIGNALEFKALIGEKNTSIYQGPETAQNKRVAAAQVSVNGAAAPIKFLFSDYLGIYPLIDLDSTDDQLLGNTASLTRYTDGEGVRAFLVMQTPGAGINATCTIEYTNSAGVTGRTISFGVLSSANIGALISQAAVNTGIGPLTPFIPLVNGDRGIRSVQSVKLDAGVGGFAVLVLCKPLFHLQAFERYTAAEKVFIKESASLPEVLPGAFLQFLCLRGLAAASQPITGFIDFIWS
jgi:hypothetical protein